MYGKYLWYISVRRFNTRLAVNSINIITPWPMTRQDPYHWNPLIVLYNICISMTASGVDVKSCQHFNSNTFPLKVVLNSAENDGGVIQIIYKVEITNLKYLQPSSLEVMYWTIFHLMFSFINYWLESWISHFINLLTIHNFSQQIFFLSILLMLF